MNKYRNKSWHIRSESDIQDNSAYSQAQNPKIQSFRNLYRHQNWHTQLASWKTHFQSFPYVLAAVKSQCAFTIATDIFTLIQLWCIFAATYLLQHLSEGPSPYKQASLSGTCVAHAVLHWKPDSHRGALQSLFVTCYILSTFQTALMQTPLVSHASTSCSDVHCSSVWQYP